MFGTKVNLLTFLLFPQDCSIKMAMGSLDRGKVILSPGQLTMVQKPDMPIFRIIDSKLENMTSSNDKNGIRMVVIMKRKITSEMMSTRVSLCDDFFCPVCEFSLGDDIPSLNPDSWCTVIFICSFTPM